MLNLKPVSPECSITLSKEYQQASGCLRPSSARPVNGSRPEAEHHLLKVNREVFPIEIADQTFYCHQEMMLDENGQPLDYATYWPYASNFIDAEGEVCGLPMHIRVETTHLERDVFVSAHDHRILVTGEYDAGKVVRRIRTAFDYDGNFLNVNYHTQDKEKPHAQDVVWIYPDRILLALGHCIDVKKNKPVNKWNDIVVQIGQVDGRLMNTLRYKSETDTEYNFLKQDELLQDGIIWTGSSTYPSSTFSDGVSIVVQDGNLHVSGNNEAWQLPLPPLNGINTQWDDSYNGHNIGESFSNALSQFERITSERINLEANNFCLKR